MKWYYGNSHSSHNKRNHFFTRAHPLFRTNTGNKQSGMKRIADKEWSIAFLCTYEKKCAGKKRQTQFIFLLVSRFLMKKHLIVFFFDYASFFCLPCKFNHVLFWDFKILLDNVMKQAKKIAREKVKKA